MGEHFLCKPSQIELEYLPPCLLKTGTHEGKSRGRIPGLPAVSHVEFSRLSICLVVAGILLVSRTPTSHPYEFVVVIVL